MNLELQNTINGCIAVERAVASIYSSFAKMFPEEKGFWEDLMSDETEHASFLTDAFSLKAGEALPSRIKPPSLPFVIKTLEFADGIRARLRSNPVSLEEALNLALTLEETMVETFVNDIIGNLLVDVPLDTELQNMLDAEKGHVQKIRDMMIRKGFLKIS
jgi:rubrerythrin